MAFFDLEKDRVYTLRGPRQVGKTTLIKLFIADLLKNGKNPLAVFYFSCDAISEHTELEEVVTQYLEYSERLASPERRYIFIDEISSLKSWERAIKILADSGRLVGSCLILTGSHCLDLKYSVERLPGRRGEAEEPLNKILVPMKFSEYVETVNPGLSKEVYKFLPLKREARFNILFDLFRGEPDQEVMDRMVLYQDDLRGLLDNYLLTGGIMRAINGYYLRGGPKSIDLGVYEIYVRSLVGDLARWGYQERFAKQVLRAVIDKMTTRVSLSAIAKETEIGSHNTVSDYLSALENSYVLSVLYQLKLEEKAADYRREKKIYLSDPLIYHALRGWVRGSSNYFQTSQELVDDDTEKSKLMEMIVLGHLLRCVYNLNPSDVFSHHEHLFFWRKKKTDREVDFVLKRGGELFPIEVKYQESVDRRDLANLFSFGRGLLISKNRFDVYKAYSTIPVETFLMLV